jgi:hypothetical protein
MEEIVNGLNGIIDPKYVTWATVAYLASQALGRIYLAIVNGGGLKSIFSAVWLGSNKPKE